VSDATKSLGANIREFRKKRGISQEALADLAGVHRTYLGGIERGERNVSLDNIVRIARALKIMPKELLNGIR